MLGFYLKSYYIIIRVIFAVIILSNSFCQFFINPHRPKYELFKWQEIASNKIIIPKLAPIKATSLRNDFLLFSYGTSIAEDLFYSNIFFDYKKKIVGSYRLRLYGNTLFMLNKNLIIQNEFEFDNQGKTDPHFEGVERGYKNGWVGYLQHSSLNYNYISGHISIGRGNPYFYNLNESLLINHNFSSPEYIWWHHENEWFKYDLGILMLSQVSNYNRFLTFHRYEISRDSWRVGFSESILGTYKEWSRSEVGYLMPSSVHLESEENRGINANLMWLFDGMIKLDSITIYGELLIDDFAIDGKSPPQIAGLFGIGKQIGQISLNAEYIHINRWTGNHCDSLKKWVEMGTPIGHSIGSNANKVILSSYIALKRKLAVEFYINSVYRAVGSSVEMLSEWPEEVKCDYNFGNYDIVSPKKNISSDLGLKVYCLTTKDLLTEIELSLDGGMWNMEFSGIYRLKN